MAENQAATMTLPMDLIKPAIEAKINAAVIEALGGSGAFIERAVGQLMNRLVDNTGKVSQYSSDNKTPWLTWAVQQAVWDAVKESITKHIGEKTDAIKASIEAEFRKSKSPMVQALIAGMVDGLGKAVADRYRMEVNFTAR